MNKTGATRYQKFLKSEKAKTRLKSKKELPKGTNVTKTNFKVKKIVIKEQLKKHSETEQLSARKLNIKELLSRLNHFNTNSRTNALEGLKELITSYPGVLEQNLGQIILGISPLILNIEKVVRRDSLKVLHLILKNIELEKLDPFFDIMSTYLRSAMTHIDNRIQDDSLNFLDILLTCTPTKIADNFYKIIPNFLDMISKLRVDSKPGRALTVNLSSQISSVKWRIKVIYRLKDFLHKYVKYNKIGNNISLNENIKTFDPLTSNHYAMFKLHNIAVSDVLNVSNNTQSVPNDEGEKFLGYVDNLMPLLFESWLEVCPSTKSDKSMETVLSEDAAILLRHVLQVISLLHKLAKHFDDLNPSRDMERIFLQKYKTLLGQHFICSFPYVTNTRLKQGKSNDSTFEDIIVDPKLTVENLELCYLFIRFNPNINIKKQAGEINMVLSYVEKIFSNKCSETIYDNILNLLHTLFSNEVTGWTKTPTVLDSVFKKIIQSYFNDHTPIKFKQVIFALLCKIALNEKLSYFHSSDVYGIWLNNLPDILLGESVSVQTVNMIHKFATTNNTLFNTVTKPKLIKIIENLPKIIISDCVGTDSYYKLFSLIYWIKPWDTDSLNLLESQLINNVYENDYGKYIFDTLRLKSGGIL